MGQPNGPKSFYLQKGKQNCRCEYKNRWYEIVGGGYSGGRGPKRKTEPKLKQIKNKNVTKGLSQKQKMHPHIVTIDLQFQKAISPCTVSYTQSTIENDKNILFK